MHKQILIDGSVRTDDLFLLGEDGELECLNGRVDSWECEEEVDDREGCDGYRQPVADTHIPLLLQLLFVQFVLYSIDLLFQ